MKNEYFQNDVIDLRILGDIGSCVFIAFQYARSGPLLKIVEFLGKIVFLSITLGLFMVRSMLGLSKPSQSDYRSIIKVPHSRSAIFGQSAQILAHLICFLHFSPLLNLSLIFFQYSYKSLAKFCNLRNGFFKWMTKFSPATKDMSAFSPSSCSKQLMDF